MNENPQSDRTEATDEPLRPLLFSLAYRMVGSVTEAEDLVQETLLRVHRAERDGVVIESRRPYSCAVVTRLSIDHLRSARVRREEYVGEWLPEPIVTDPSLDPAAHAELADSLSMAFLVLLETLTPPERAVLLLRDVFGFGFDEVAELIDKTEDNTRQIASRARRRVAEGKPRFEASVQRRWALAERFFAAVDGGDPDALVAMLAEDATMYGDGGGVAAARRVPVQGGAAVARFLHNLGVRGRCDGLRLTLMDVNGQPGAVAHDPEGRTVAVMALDIVDGRVQTVRSVVNPDKLGHVGAAQGRP